MLESRREGGQAGQFLGEGDLDVVARGAFVGDEGGKFVERGAGRGVRC